MTITRYREAFQALGFDIEASIEFLQYDCRIHVGYEAQLVGLKVPSVTSTALISYVLSYLGSMSDLERTNAIRDMFRFAKIDADQTAKYGTTHPNSWSTAQVALSFFYISDEEDVIQHAVEGVLSYQKDSGAWTFSCSHDEGIMYALYPSIVLIKANRRFAGKYEEPLRRTLNWLRNLRAPATETEKLIYNAIMLRIVREIGDRESEGQLFRIGFAKLIDREFSRLVFNEYTNSPFSMRPFGPALYLAGRPFLNCDHPFAIYCIKSLQEGITEDRRSWPLLVPDREINQPSSFCTALALLTIVEWLKDARAQGREPLELLPLSKSLREVKNMVANLEDQKKIFVSYSSSDESVVTRIVKALEANGFKVVYAEVDLLVGDSIPGFINSGLADMDYFVICLSPKAVASKFVRDEMDGAKAAEWARDRKTIIPALIEKCEVPPLFAAKKWADFTDVFGDGIRELIAGIEGRRRVL